MSVQLTDFADIESVRRALVKGETEESLKNFASETFVHQEKVKYYSLIDTAVSTNERNSSFIKRLKFTSSIFDGCIPPPWQPLFSEDLMNMEAMVQMKQLNQLSFNDIHEIVDQEYKISKDKERLHRSAAFAEKVYESRKQHLVGNTPYSIANFLEDKQAFHDQYPKIEFSIF